MKKHMIAFAFVAGLGAASGAAIAQTDHSAHGAAAADSAALPAVQGFKAAMDKMHADMAAQQYTGNADVDFVRGMIPHHQGAIDMAKVVLEHGKDPDIRKLAEGVISAQEAEITQMNEWLAKNAK